MSKADLAEELAEKFGKFRDNLAAVLPDNGHLAVDLERLPLRTLNGLLDMLYVLEKQDDKLYEAFNEWWTEDAGGGSLTLTIQGRLGFKEWDRKRRRS